MLTWLDCDTPFPDVRLALPTGSEAPGLLAVGGDLSAERLLAAYRQGIFPWYSDGQPILWWSTDPRMILRTSEFKISRSFRKTLKKIENSITEGGEYSVRFDFSFRKVIECCARLRAQDGGTWISDEIIDAYVELHHRGYAHSSELWRNGMLVGGAYGVAIGRMFYGESMFALEPDASKVALAYLVHFLKMNDVELIDCQQETKHLASLGAYPISRERFTIHLHEQIDKASITLWQPELMFHKGDEQQVLHQTQT